jgi:hypothetical protein
MKEKRIFIPMEAISEKNTVLDKKKKKNKTETVWKMLFNM